MPPRKRVPPKKRELPADGPVEIAGVKLPSGRRLRGALASRRLPTIWITDALIPNPAKTWSDLLARQPDTGLVPIILDSLAGDATRPWDELEFGSGYVDEIRDHRTGVLLKEWWAHSFPDQVDDQRTESYLEPFGRSFPGLALPTPPRRADLPSLDTVLHDVARSPARLGVVIAEHTADVVAAVGWLGTANHRLMAPEAVSAVLRSWENRFDATLFRLGFAEMDLLVGRPPQTVDDALAIAAEHFAFSSDTIMSRAGSIRTWASDLVQASCWSFWWD
jgi:hypothetical protein